MDRKGSPRHPACGWRWLGITVFAAALALHAPQAASQGRPFLAIKFHGTAVDQPPGLQAGDLEWLEQRLGARFTLAGHARDGALRIQFVGPLDDAQARDILKRARALPGVLYADMTKSSAQGNDRAPAGRAAPPSVGVADWTTSGIVVRLKPGAPGEKRGVELAEATLPALEAAAGMGLRVARFIDGERVLLRLDSALPHSQAEALAARLAAVPGIAVAEPDARVSTALAATDPRFSSQWNLVDTGGINVGTAWNTTTGNPGVVVAVVDSGRVLHPDLESRWGLGFGFVTVGGERDTNVLDPGPATCPVGQPTTTAWHGTRVAGIVGAGANNGQGIAGINWASKILPVRAIGPCGGDQTDVADAIKWAAGVSVPGTFNNPTPAKVINVSLGNAQSYCPEVYQNAINAALARGAVVVVASGNGFGNARDFTPANCSGVITVAATDINGARAAYSNVGDAVDVAAPGGYCVAPCTGLGILSTVKGANPPDWDWLYDQGTSYAAPHVSGLASLLLSAKSLAPFQVQMLLESGTTPTPSCTGCANGRINAGAAMAALPGVASSQVGSLDPTFAGGSVVAPMPQAFATAASPVAIPALDGADTTFLAYSTVNDGATTQQVGLVRVDASGLQDTTFSGGNGGVALHDMSQLCWGAPGKSSPESVVVEPGGKLLVSANTSPRLGLCVARFNANGTLDATFGSPASGVAKATYAGDSFNDPGGSRLAIFADRIYAMRRSCVGGTVKIARFLSSGALDNTWGASGLLSVALPVADCGISGGLDLAVDASGNLFVSGHYGDDGENHDGVWVRKYSPSGVLDTSFATGGRFSFAASTARPGGKFKAHYATVNAAGIHLLMATADAPTFAASATTQNPLGTGATTLRVLPSGALDSAFGGAGFSYLAFADPRPEPAGPFHRASGLLVQGDGKIVGVGAKLAFRLHSNGTLDTSFGMGGRIILDFGSYSNAEHALLPAAVGKLLVAGTLRTTGSNLRAYVARFITGDGTAPSGCYVDPQTGTCSSSGSLGLGNRSVGSEGTNGIVFRNNGTTRLTIARVIENDQKRLPVVSYNAPGEFAWYSDSCGDPAQLDPGQQCTINIRFTPMGTGNRSGALFINTDSAQGNFTIPLVGQGLQAFTLNVAKAGSGVGVVTSAPGSISCGSACSEAFSAGATVTLTAQADVATSTFAGWAGACSGLGTCTVTMDANRDVTATFNLSNPVTGNTPVIAAAAYLGASGDQRARALSVAGGAVFLGGVHEAGGNREGLVASYATGFTNGAVPAWSTTWPAALNQDEFMGIAATSGASPGVHAAGYSYSKTNDVVGGKEWKGIAVKFPFAGGSPAWEKQTPPTPAFNYSGTEQAMAIAAATELTQNYFYVTGWGQADGSNPNRFFITKLDSLGVLVWTRTDLAEMVGIQGSRGNSVALLNGNAYAAGVNVDDGFNRPMLRKYGADGTLAWSRKTTDRVGEYLGVAAFGSALYAVGYAGNFGASSDFLVEKWDEAGNRVWSRTFDRSSQQDVLHAIVGVSGSLFAAGYTRGGTAGGADAVLLQFDPTTGNLLTSTLHGGPQDDFAYAIATDGTQVYVAGESGSLGGGGGADAMLLRYTLGGAGTDDTPDPFSFADVAGVATGATVTSDAITVTGINTASGISVTGGLYSIGPNGPFTSAAGTVQNNQTVRVQHVASSSAGTATSTTLTIGGISDTFTSTTAFAGDTVPDPFTFTAKSGVLANTPVISDPATITGITVPAPISVANGSYSINGGAFTTSPSTITNGQSVRVQHTSAAANGTATTTTLTIGGVNGLFTSTTESAAGAGSIVFGSAHYFGSPSSDERAHAVALGGGAVYVAGFRTAPSTGDFEGLVARYNLPLATGATPAWNTTWPTAIGEDMFHAVTVNAGGVFAAGSGYAPLSDTAGIKENKGVVLRYAPANPADSTVIQVPPAPGAFPYGGSEAVKAIASSTESGQEFTYAVGYAQQSFENSCRFFISKVNAVGTVLWTRTDLAEMVGSACSAGNGVALLNGHAYGAGATRNSGAPRPMLRKYDTAGNLVWVRIHAETVGDYRAVAAFGNALYAVGQTGDGDTSASDFLVDKWSEDGTLLWSRTFDRAAAQDTLSGVVGAANSIFAVGATRGSTAGGFDAVILEIDPANGDLVRATLHGGTLDDRAYAVATDGSSLFVAGHAQSSGMSSGGLDLMLLRYALTVSDTTPESFAFESQSGVTPSTAIVSNAVTITGINAAAPVTVANGEYSIDGGAFTQVAGAINAGQSVRVRHLSSSANSASVTTTLTIGGVIGTFTTFTADSAGGGSLTFVGSTQLVVGSDQAFTALAVGPGALFVAGRQTSPSGEAEAILARYPLPPGPNANYAWLTVWPPLPGYDVFNAIGSGADSVYGAGTSAQVTDTTGTFENKGIVVKFPHGAAGFSPATWQRQAPAAPGAYAFGGTEWLQGLAVASEAGQEFVYVTGYGEASFANDCRFFLSKLSAAGAVAWTRTDEAEMVSNRCTTGFGVAILNGQVYAAGGSTDDGAWRPMLRKYDPAGNLAWARRTTTVTGRYVGVAAFGGAIYAVGNSGEPDTTASDFLVEKWDEAGNRLWSRTFDRGAAFDELRGVVGAGGSIFAVGATRGATNGGRDAIVLEIDPANGNLVKSTLFGGPQDEVAHAVATDGCNVYVAGEVAGGVAGADGFLLQYGLANSATCPVSPGAVAFGGQSMGTTSPPQAITFRNTTGATVTVGPVAVPPQFQAVHDCANLAPAASCTVQVSFAPAIQPIALNGRAAVTGTLSISTSSPALSATVGLSGTAEKSLVTHYYRSILRRAPDPNGLIFWEAEAARAVALGMSLNEVWYAMAQQFYFSPEYASFARDDPGFITDLYNTFFNRLPDAGGLAFWVSRLASVPREVMLAEFMFSPEFRAFAQAIFNAAPVRPEFDMASDFYRGILARLPDSGGFAFWLGRLRAAQCTSGDRGNAVNAAVEEVSQSFVASGEYAGKLRTNPQFVGDMYNAFFRRGAGPDVAGVTYWINQLATLSRDAVRKEFVKSQEFQARVIAVINAGCGS